MEVKQVVEDIKRNFQDILAIALFFILPFNHKFSNLTLAIIIVASIATALRNKAMPRFQVFWFLPALFAYYILSELLSGGTFQSLEKRIILIVVPIAFALTEAFSKGGLQRKFYLAYVWGNFFAAVICLLRAAYRSFSLVDGSIKFDPIVIEDPGSNFLTSSVYGGNYFFGNELSFMQPTPTYFGIYIVFAQYLIFRFFLTSGNKMMWMAVYIFFLMVLFFLSSKAAILSALFLSVYIAFYILTRSKLHYALKVLLIAGILSVSVASLFINPRFHSLKEAIISKKWINENARFGDDLRFLTWDASIEVIKSNWLFGVGEARKTEALAKVYNAKGYDFPSEQLFNSHNQFLDFMVGGGLIALGLFIGGLGYLFTQSVKRKNQVLLAFLLIITFNILFENVLSRHAGILLFAVFTTLHLVQPKKPEGLKSWF
jgi:O-antigen ligase